MSLGDLCACIRVYCLLIKSAAKSIVKLAVDPHYVGGLVGVMFGLTGLGVCGNLGL